ncbi:MAG: hypothetical protein KKA19_09330 [Candidatus Margulisbacteria bacterium]|nr:hypothetical protein [Candidatus Margulisiibacteriota bacterium]
MSKGKKKIEPILINNVEQGKELRNLYQACKNNSSTKDAHKIIKLFVNSIPNLVKRDLESNTFFISPYAEDIIKLLQKSESKLVCSKVETLKDKIFNYIDQQNMLVNYEEKYASVYYVKRDAVKTEI